MICLGNIIYQLATAHNFFDHVASNTTALLSPYHDYYIIKIMTQRLQRNYLENIFGLLHPFLKC